MKHLVTAMIVMGTSSFAMADGFKCETRDGDLVVKVYNHVQPEEGTRNGAVMVISDKNVQLGRKTIARFTDVNSTLKSKGALYMAKVDLRFADSRRKGELIGGTKLGQLANISLDVDFKYNRPLEDGEETTGELVLDKRNGDSITLDVDCVRYLKSE